MKRNVIKKLSGLTRHREFIGHIGTIVSGRSIAATVALLTTPIIARLFEPADYGTASAFLAIAGIASQVASLRYESAIVLPRESGEALLLAVLANRILPLFCLLLLAVFLFIEVIGAEWKTLELMGAWVWMLPLFVLLMGAQDIQESWLARGKSFGVISASVVAETVLGASSRIGFGVISGSSIFGLLMGSLLGVIGRLAVQGLSDTVTIKATFSSVNYAALKDIARRYSDFARLNAPAGLIYAIGQNAPVLLFSAMFSPAVAGFFAMANRLSRMPVQIVAMSVRRVFLKKASDIHNDGRQLRKSFVLITLGLFGLGLLPCAVVWLYGEAILSWLLGDKWRIAGYYLELIAPWVLMAWTTAPCNPIYIVLRRQDRWLTQQLLTTVLRLAAFAIGSVLEWGPEATLQLFVWLTILSYVIMIATTFCLAGQKPRPPSSKQLLDMRGGDS